MTPGIDYNTYYEMYISLTGDNPVANQLQEGLSATTSFFEGIPFDKHEYQYEEGKWSPKEVLLHIIDTERVFAYRALQFARAENVVIKGFDQDEFANNARPVTRSMQELLEEYTAVRQSTIAMAKSFSENTLARRGEASNSPLSVMAALRIICGHEKHHAKIIKERYL
ncbi:DinB family protein [Aureisphaera galaxeae]|uniref:DinB family protein n=1 Tax=Aureisphaera galaxeae TaxID=1538023 RepID=UPI002350B8DA|nr:DinB family protein [Aureisphaera galaxeae]MDC8004022.1 DinB family protein [Aureisphaera galaxeae]